MSPHHLLNILSEHSYLYLFFVLFIEGPITTFIAGSLAALGHFNFWLVYLVAVLADITGDNILYAIGRFGRHGAESKVGRWLGVKTKNLLALEKGIGKNAASFLIIGKLAGTGHELGGAVLLTAGIAKVPYARFFTVAALTTLFKSFVVLCLGYYFGGKTAHLSVYYRYTDLSLFIILLMAGWYFGRKYMTSISTEKIV